MPVEGLGHSVGETEAMEWFHKSAEGGMAEGMLVQHRPQPRLLALGSLQF